MNSIKPMLAFTVADKTKLRFPYLVSPKLDGIRCLIVKGQVLSRSFKPIRNKFVVSQLQGLDNLDGELIVGSPNSGEVFNRTTHGVMSEHGEPRFQFHVFDTLDDLSLPFKARLAKVPEHPYVQAVPHTMVHNLNDLCKLEAQVLENGYEGLILRNPDSLYKCGRSTVRENALGKLKTFQDGELMISDVLEGSMNINYPTTDALGRTVRSTHQGGMVPNQMVGTICGHDLKTGQYLELSPGKMTHDVRSWMWRNQADIIGKIAKYKAFGYGSLHAPRFATFQAFRHTDDL